MKKSNLFWGFFLLTLGALILLTKYDALNVDWYFVWELYPLILIFFGLMLIVSGKILKSFIAILFGIVFSILIFGTLMNILDENPFTNHYESDDFSKSHFFESYDDYYQSAHLILEGGAGKISIGGNTDRLIEGNYYGERNIYELSKRGVKGKALLKLESEFEKVKFLNDDFKNDLDLKLNSSPVWSFNFKLGAVKADFDLSDKIVDEIKIAAGASSITIKLGNKQKSLLLKSEAGATKLKVLIPASSGVKLIREGVLNSKYVKDFIKRENGIYYSENYELSGSKVFIKMNGAFTQLNIERY